MSADITRLQCFVAVAVAEELHFKRAADRLRISPPPLTRQIKLFEKQPGGDLFERKHHEVQLTSLGAQLLDRVRAILQQVEESTQKSGVTKKMLPPHDRHGDAMSAASFIDGYRLR